MADHLDAPGLQPPLGDVMTDITDVYAFLKPDDDSEPPGKSILVLDVNPLTLGTAFDTTADYLINLDTSGDAVADITFRMRFTGGPGAQMATVERITGAGPQVVIANAPVSGPSETRITVNGAYKFFAGVRSDPFFFDLLGFLNNFQFTGSDFFSSRNVFGIVLEVPNKALGSNPSSTSLWARTRIPVNGVVSNDDRMGRAAINTVFNHGQDKNLFNSLDPAQDRTATNNEGITFVQSFTNTLVALSNLGGHAGYSQGQAMGIADILLPDMLTYDFSKPTNYAQLNGRRLQDDVIDISLNLVTNGLLTGDGVGPHGDYLDHFPYLGNPH
ncbi:MAG TPA: DUF4331 family protein [Candidatus Dormibacteraeota bacterium]